MIPSINHVEDDIAHENTKVLVWLKTCWEAKQPVNFLL
jgi:hypothetical protein